MIAIQVQGVSAIVATLGESREIDKCITIRDSHQINNKEGALREPGCDAEKPSLGQAIAN